MSVFKSVNGKTNSDQAHLSDGTGFNSSLPAQFIGCGPRLPKRFVLLQKQKRSCAAHVLSSALLQALDSFHPKSSCSFKSSTAKNLCGATGDVG
jgi:hypothetical protein